MTILNKKNLLSLNPQIKIEASEDKFNEENSRKFINNCDL